MKRAYRYLTYADRQRVEAAHGAGARTADIAAQLGVSTAAIYHELKRGDAGAADAHGRPGYSADVAQRRLQESFRRRGRKRAAESEAAT